jgi:hypothetical protein
MNEELTVWRKEMNDCMISAMKNVKRLSDSIVLLANDIEEIKDTLKKRVYLSNSHLMQVKKAVNTKTSEICKETGYEYRKAYRFIIQAIYRSINGQYNVPSYRELPEAYFLEILEAISIWKIPSTIEERIQAA